MVGLGLSGLTVARFLAGQSAMVTVSDIKPEKELEPQVLKELSTLGINLETGGHHAKTFSQAEIIILSPGVPHDTEVLMAARSRGIPVMGELELSSRLIDIPMIAVTGTNGKSTVTAFLGAMLEQAGFNVFVGGNIGTPLMAYVANKNKKADYAVVEVSSFQLDTIRTFCPHVSLILNITPDHLDRYTGFEAYVRAKLRIFENQGAGQYLILNDNDQNLSAVKPASGVSVLRYGMEEKSGRNAWVEKSKIHTRWEGSQRGEYSLEGFRLPGLHNVENLMGVVLAGLVLNLEPHVIQAIIDHFEGLPNRMEWVREIDGIEFYNDSKATNVDAAVRAIASFGQPLIIIAGGRHKGADYAPLVTAAKEKARKAIFLGEAKDLLATAFDGSVPFSFAEDMGEAVSLAFSSAERGDAVLLAPACSSFDMFLNYSDRGKAFRAAVEKLSRGGK